MHAQALSGLLILNKKLLLEPKEALKAETDLAPSLHAQVLKLFCWCRAGDSCLNLRKALEAETDVAPSPHAQFYAALLVLSGQLFIAPQEALEAETEGGMEALARSISATSLGSAERDGVESDLGRRLGSSLSLSRQHTGVPLLSKLESIASSAVRAADKVGASLIIVYTQSGA